MTQILGGWGGGQSPVPQRYKSQNTCFVWRIPLQTWSFLPCHAIHDNCLSYYFYNVYNARRTSRLVHAAPARKHGPSWCPSTSSLHHSPCGCEDLLEELNYEGKFQVSPFPEPAVLISEKTCHRDACSSVFTATLFKIAKVWKQARFPATGEWIRNMQHRYTGTLFQL